jgi:hypothetical protein
MALYDPDQQPAVTTAADAVLAVAWAQPHQLALRLHEGTATRVQNLVKLAKYLRALPDGYERFGMGTYFMAGRSELEPEQVQHGGSECGTSACAVGHAIGAGIAAQPGDHTWFVYGSRCFTEAYDDYVFCFGGYWYHTDDTPRGAAARICFLLAGGSAAVQELCGLSLGEKIAFYHQYVA